VREYGIYSTEQLINAMLRIKKRLGPLETKTAVAHLLEAELAASFAILLRYYDKHYGQTKAQHRIEAGSMDAAQIAGLLQKQFL